MFVPLFRREIAFRLLCERGSLYLRAPEQGESSPMDGVLAGRYELEVSLGRGGSGEVWRGRDMATHRVVAIKLVELSAIDDPGMLAETIARFRREATVVSGVQHPNHVICLHGGGRR